MSHFDEESLRELAAQLTADGIDVVRIGYSDLIGTERGRDILVDQFDRTVGDGVAFCRSVYGTSPMGDVVDIAGGLSAGLPDIVGLPGSRHARKPCRGSQASRTSSPTSTTPTVRCRRRARAACSAAWSSGSPSWACSRSWARSWSSTSSSRTRVRANGWRRYGEATGNVYVAGLKGDPENILLASLRELRGVRHRRRRGEPRVLQRPVRDQPVALRGARRRRPRIPVQDRRQGAGPAPGQDGDLHGQAVQRRGWLRLPRPLLAPSMTRAGRCSTTPPATDGLSKAARSAIAGVLAHAPALAAISNPTVNSYKRFGPDTLAPWLVDWGLDNRSAMVRIPPERGRASRMELRLGDASREPVPRDRRPAGGGVSRHPRRARAAREARGLRIRPVQGEQAAQGSGRRARRPRGGQGPRRRSSARTSSSTLRHLQAQRARALQPVRDRLGVPGVRLPPVRCGRGRGESDDDATHCP